MATLPTVPSFVTGETPSIAKLSQLAYCVSFFNTIPAFGSFTDTGQSIANNTNTALTWTKVTDRDGGWAAGNPTRYTAQTAGYYQASALLSFNASATGGRAAWFQVTTGANNPGGAGLTQPFGYSDSGPDGTSVTGVRIGELSPYLYALDYVEVFAWQLSGGALMVSATFQVSLESLGP